MSNYWAIDVNAAGIVVGIDTRFVDSAVGATRYLKRRIAGFAHGETGRPYSSEKFRATSAGAVGQRFGLGSPLYHIAKALFPTNEDEVVGTIPVTFYPLGDQDGGRAATGSISPQGDLREAATYRVVVNNLRSAAFRLTPGMTADAMSQAVNSTLDLPVETDEGEFTAKWAGSSSNGIRLAIQGPDVGLTWAFQQPPRINAAPHGPRERLSHSARLARPAFRGGCPAARQAREAGKRRPAATPPGTCCGCGLCQERSRGRLAKGHRAAFSRRLWPRYVSPSHLRALLPSAVKVLSPGALRRRPFILVSCQTRAFVPSFEQLASILPGISLARPSVAGRASTGFGRKEIRMYSMSEPKSSLHEFRPGEPVLSVAASMRWLILATLGCVATNGCGSQADQDFAGGAEERTVEGVRAVPTQTGCEGGVEIGGGFVRCSDGMRHRPSIEACPSILPRPEPLDEAALQRAREDFAADRPAGAALDDAALYPCREDADCTEEPNGYCEITTRGFGPPPTLTVCRYGCTEDSACGAAGTGVCLCGVGSLVGRCRPASCTSDADCDGDLLCTDYVADPGCGGTRFSCQSPEDECASDSQRTEGFCAYAYGNDGQETHRSCQGASCAIGRPFLVSGHERLAAVARRSDWLAGDATGPTPADAELRQCLATEWLRLGLMEHASVAAFARFSMQLMAWGAPAELVEASTTAMRDETRHARLCFSLAERFSGQQLGPGALNVSEALDEWDLESALRTTLAEGCIGETVAALEAAHAGQHCRDPHTRQVLAGIAVDESQHARLAWRFVQWVLEQEPRLASVPRELVAGLPCEGSATAAITLHARAMLQWGVVDDALRPALRAQALHETVLPCAQELRQASVAQAA